MKKLTGLLVLGLVLGVVYLWRSQSGPPQVSITPKQRVLASASQTPQTAMVSTRSSSAETTHQLQVLHEIFTSKNDNDPRMDQDLRVLSDEAKSALEADYDQLQPEARNERGTIVFLIGRNLSSPKDFQFLTKVLLEDPCLSLSSCKGKSAADSSHSENLGVDTTLQYPQLTALKALENLLARDPKSPEALAALKGATQSKNLTIAQKAAALANRQIKYL